MEKIENQLLGTGMPVSESLTIGLYFQILTRLLGQPRWFFAELPMDFGWKRPFAFLLVSSLFFTGASLISSMPDRALLFGSLFFINAVAMTLIAAAVGYGVMLMFLGRRVPFARVFSVYALSSGVTLLAAWVPFFIWMTEPWKWWLIGTGLARGLGFSWRETLVVIGVSVIVIWLFFWSLLPVLAMFR